MTDDKMLMMCVAECNRLKQENEILINALSIIASGEDDDGCIASTGFIVKIAKKVLNEVLNT